MDIVETPVEPKRRGRPQGAKDRVPRKKAPEPQEAPEPEALPPQASQASPEPQALPQASPEPQALPQALPEPTPEPTPEPQPKKKGRPYGAKDRVPRKIQIAEIDPEPASQASQASQSSQASPPQAPQAEPEPDPHVLLRQAADNLVQLKRLANCRAKAKTCEAYTQKLHSLTPSACF